MKYAVIQVSNGNYSIVSEWSDLDKAIINFHAVCTALWNAEDVTKACVVIVDENMVLHKIEKIKYSAEV